MRKPKAFARIATARATWPKAMKPSVCPIRRGWLSAGRPSFQRPSRTMRSCTTRRRHDESSSIMAWSATSSMKVSGTLVTGMPLAVGAYRAERDDLAALEAVDHALGELHALGIERVAVVRAGDEGIFRRAVDLDDLGVERGERLVLDLVAPATNREARSLRRNDLEFWH